MPDIPLEETEVIRHVAASHGLELVLLTTPTTPQARMQRIAQASEGFVYLVSLTGARRHMLCALVFCCACVCVRVWERERERVRALGRGSVRLLRVPTPPRFSATRARRQTNTLACAPAPAGVTGVRGTMEARVEGLIEQLKSVTDKAVCVGFGVSGPEQVRAVSLTTAGSGPRACLAARGRIAPLHSVPCLVR